MDQAVNKSIRELYDKFGVSEYYQSDLLYKNPHERNIKQLIEENHHTLDFSYVLDLACGDGLVTKTLQSLGYQNIIGADPFLYNRYENETGLKCLKLSFKDIVSSDCLDYNFSSIICSFGLHLCEGSMIHSLLWKLSQCSDNLIVISPTKFPYIGEPVIEKFSLTENKKRVHLRIYKLNGKI